MCVYQLKEAEGTAGVGVGALLCCVTVKPVHSVCLIAAYLQMVKCIDDMSYIPPKSFCLPCTTEPKRNKCIATQRKTNYVCSPMGPVTFVTRSNYIVTVISSSGLEVI